MTKYEAEIIYYQLYEEKVSEWKKETVDTEFFILPAIFLVGLCILIAGPWTVSIGTWLIFFLYFGIVLVMSFVDIGITLYTRKKLPRDFADFIHAGLCSISLDKDDKGNAYYDIDMGRYLHKRMPEDEVKGRLMRGVGYAYET